MGLTSSRHPENDFWNSILDIKPDESGAITGNVCVVSRAAPFRKLSGTGIWEAFLETDIMTVATTPNELKDLFNRSCSAANSRLSADELEGLIELLVELSDKKSLDVISVCSACLFLNCDESIDEKIELLYNWIDLQGEHSVGYADMLVALSSFDRGISAILGRPASSEIFLQAVTAEWLSQADPNFSNLSISNRSGSGPVLQASVNNGISKPKSSARAVVEDAGDPAIPVSSATDKRLIIDFCHNRQFVVRRLLELICKLPVATSSAEDVKKAEAITAVISKASDDSLFDKPLTGGDEWMANPAWKKTAEKMTPRGVSAQKAAPESGLLLEWVHG